MKTYINHILKNVVFFLHYKSIIQVLIQLPNAFSEANPTKNIYFLQPCSIVISKYTNLVRRGYHK